MRNEWTRRYSGVSGCCGESPARAARTDGTKPSSANSCAETIAIGTQSTCISIDGISGANAVKPSAGVYAQHGLRLLFWEEVAAMFRAARRNLIAAAAITLGMCGPRIAPANTHQFHDAVVRGNSSLQNSQRQEAVRHDLFHITLNIGATAKLQHQKIGTTFFETMTKIQSSA